MVINGSEHHTIFKIKIIFLVDGDKLSNIILKHNTIFKLKIIFLKDV